MNWITKLDLIALLIVIILLPIFIIIIIIKNKKKKSKKNNICYICNKEFFQFKDNKAFFTEETGKIFTYYCCNECEIKINKLVRDYVKKEANIDN